MEDLLKILAWDKMPLKLYKNYEDFIVCQRIKKVSSVVAGYKLSLANVEMQNTNSTNELTNSLSK